MVEMVLLGVPRSVDTIWIDCLTIWRCRWGTWHRWNCERIPENLFWFQTWLLTSGCCCDHWVCCVVRVCLCIHDKGPQLPKEMKKEVSYVLDMGETIKWFLRSYSEFRHDFIVMVALMIFGFAELLGFVFAWVMWFSNFQCRWKKTTSCYFCFSLLMFDDCSRLSEWFLVEETELVLLVVSKRTWKWNSNQLLKEKPRNKTFLSLSLSLVFSVFCFS